jgi:L-ascorbate metabolism protein UlaG (beta-lactamase superfamily)
VILGLHGEDFAMPLQIHWIGHASFRLASEDAVLYIDPWKLSSAQPDADLVFVSHAHFDHWSADDVAAVSRDTTTVVGPADVVASLPGGSVLRPGDRIESAGACIEGVRAYNLDKDFHPKANDWLGAVVTLGGKRVYYAGDTDRIPEMGELSEVDVALLPVGGTYTMNAAQAAEACQAIAAKTAVPYHWGDIVGTEADAQTFVDATAGCDARLIRPGEVLWV